MQETLAMVKIGHPSRLFTCMVSLGRESHPRRSTQHPPLGSSYRQAVVDRTINKLSISLGTHVCPRCSSLLSFFCGISYKPVKPSRIDVCCVCFIEGAEVV